MASVTSLGIHRPSALQYLVAESILPPDVADDQYEWQTSDGFECEENISEEIVTTPQCVVWSRGGIVQRVFRFEVEKEEVIQAGLTWFPTEDPCNTPFKTSWTRQCSEPSLDHGTKASKKKVGESGTAIEAQAQGSPSLNSVQLGAVDAAQSSRRRHSIRALVVVLKTQVHIYLLSGTSHVLNLPFEVDLVLPTPQGLLLQRKLPEQLLATQLPVAYAGPPNSFASPQTQRWTPQSSYTAPQSPGSAPSVVPAIQIASTTAVESDSRQTGTNAQLPRLFSLTDTMSELGLVVATAVVGSNIISGRAGKRVVPLNSLNHTEGIVYVSKDNELRITGGQSQSTQHFLLAVTSNEETGMYTIWSFAYLTPQSVSEAAKLGNPTTSETLSRRRSSYGMAGTGTTGTGATTPVGRGPISVRESFGTRTRNQNVLGSSNANVSFTAQGEDTKLDLGSELTSQLDPEFENPGVPAKSSRRVSSLLARADLSTGHDKLAFSDLVNGHPGAAGSHSNNNRRGESFGGYGSRGSFGNTIGSSRRGSVPPSSYYLGVGHGNDKYQEPSVEDLMDELNEDNESNEHEEQGRRAAVGGLRKEVVLTNIGSFPTRRPDIRRLAHNVNTRFESKVFTLLPPRSPCLDDTDRVSLYVCIVNKTDRRLLVLKTDIPYHVDSRRPREMQTTKPTKAPEPGLPLAESATEMRRCDGVIDACRLTQGNIHRMLVLSETDSGHAELTLQAPWSTLVKIELPSRLAIYHPFQLGPAVPPSRRREGGLKRVLSRGPKDLLGLQHEAYGGQVDILDEEGTRHRVQVQLVPHDTQVAKILSVCQFVLPTVEHGGDGMLIGWWVVLQWLHNSVGMADDHEWTALVVLLFALAVGFVNDGFAESPSKQKKKKSGLLRSSSGANVDLEFWDSMLEQEGGAGSAGPRWSKCAAWEWTLDPPTNQPMAPGQKPSGSTRLTRSSTVGLSAATNLTTHNQFIIRCASWAREFQQSPAGKLASGKSGYLPTAASKSPDVRRTALATILIGLHLLEEETKLDVACSAKSGKGVSRLTPVLAQLGAWLDWPDWSWKANAYYNFADAEMEQWSFEDAVMNNIAVPAQPFAPPSVLSFVASCLRRDPSTNFLSLLDLVNPGQSSKCEGRRRVDYAGYDLTKSLTPRTVLIVKLISKLSDANKPANQIVKDLTRSGVHTHLLETMPEGLAASLWEAIIQCQENPPINWDVRTLELVGRNDLSMLLSTGKTRNDSSTSRVTLSHEASRDVHNIGNSTLETDTIGAFDGSAEVDRQSVTRLIFREDRRFIEASKLLHPMKPAIARCVPEPEWSEADLLEAQKDLVQTVAIRTLAIPPGRGLLYYSARVPLLTEKFPIHGFALSCVMKPSNNTVTADRNAFTEEKVAWAFFHAGVSAGLMISRDAKGIDTSWIQFNKPAELNNRHAGFLLALGLNGHLRSVAKWVAFKYLTPKHTMTSIGLLLGLSASYLGTMDTLVTRLLSVHVTRMLPPGAAELNLSPLTQTTGIMGIGLLYCGTQHRRMSEVMLSEIEHIDQEDPSTPLETLRDEGYRLAAGFALGYINLGKGKDLKGLHDMAIIERLLSLAVGTKKVSIVHILDKATAGATIAISLIFMKSHNEALARKIDIPDTIHQFGYVRPDIFLLRTVARHLILWNDIQATSAWIQSVLPPMYKERVSMTSMRILNSEDLPFYNIMAGICFSIGLRFAGSGSLEVRNLLGHYLDQFMRICKMPAMNYDGKLTRTTVRNCQDLVALSAACVMAGSGDIHIFRRLRALHGRVSADTPYGSHLAAHIAIGVLFLGGGSFTFGTSNIAVASLLCAFYPLFPTSVLDNKSHLQAFRHFWVLATEARCLVARDVDTNRPVSVPISVTLRDGSERATIAPGLLPELDDIAIVRTNSMAYWQITLDFANNPFHLSTFQRNQSIHVRKRAPHDGHSSVFSATLQALNDSQTSNTSRQVFDSIFNLPALAGLDKAQQALIIPPDAGSAAHAGTKGTMVDDRLVLERAWLWTGNRDRLWNLKLLFDWAEVVRRKDGKIRWLGNDVIEGLRAAVWMASNDEK